MIFGTRTQIHVDFRRFFSIYLRESASYQRVKPNLPDSSKEKGFDKPLHSPYFDFDEDVLALGAAVQAQAVTDFLLS